MHWSYVFLVLTLVLLSIWIFKTFWPLIFQLATLTPWMALMGWWDSELIACGGKASREHSRCLSSVEANNVDAEKWTFLAPWGCAVRAHLTATGKRKQGRGLFQYKWPSFLVWRFLFLRSYNKSSDHCDGLVQDCSNSIASSLELLQYCNKLLI